MLSADTTVTLVGLSDSRNMFLQVWSLNLDSEFDEEHTPTLFSTFVSKADPHCPSIMSLTSMCMR